jgi:DNA-binding response OmpR family regulator
MTPQPTRILIIEDDPAVASSLREGLEREGYTIIWKDTGQDGVNYARDHTPHLIVLDVRLPDGSGFDFCRQMRQLKLTLPIIMLTVRRDDVDKVLGLEMGADDYVTKPYSLQVLRSRIRAQLRRVYGEYATSNSEVIYAGDLIIDRTKAQVHRGDHLLNLTPTEFRLVTLLAQNAGRTLSRRQILDALWGDADLESERMVNVHIRRLRGKVELDPSRPAVILTIPGVGYRFEG